MSSATQRQDRPTASSRMTHAVKTAVECPEGDVFAVLKTVRPYTGRGRKCFSRYALTPATMPRMACCSTRTHRRRMRAISTPMTITTHIVPTTHTGVVQKVATGDSQPACASKAGRNLDHTRLSNSWPSIVRTARHHRQAAAASMMTPRMAAQTVAARRGRASSGSCSDCSSVAGARPWIF